MISLNGGYAMIKYNSTQEELQIAYRSKKPVLCYDENRRAHWAVIEETATESVDEETQELITIYEYSYRLIDEASGGVHLYEHNIRLSGYNKDLNRSPLDVSFRFYLSTNEPLTYEGVTLLLNEKGYSSFTQMFSVNSRESINMVENKDSFYIIGIISDAGDIYAKIQYTSGANIGTIGQTYFNAGKSCKDTITQIL